MGDSFGIPKGDGDGNLQAGLSIRKVIEATSCKSYYGFLILAFRLCGVQQASDRRWRVHATLVKLATEIIIGLKFLSFYHSSKWEKIHSASLPSKILFNERKAGPWSLAWSSHDRLLIWHLGREAKSWVLSSLWEPIKGNNPSVAGSVGKMLWQLWDQSPGPWSRFPNQSIPCSPTIAPLNLPSTLYLISHLTAVSPNDWPLQLSVRLLRFVLLCALIHTIRISAQLYIAFRLAKPHWTPQRAVDWKRWEGAVCLIIGFRYRAHTYHIMFLFLFN